MLKLKVTGNYIIKLKTDYMYKTRNQHYFKYYYLWWILLTNNTKFKYFGLYKSIPNAVCKKASSKFT